MIPNVDPRQLKAMMDRLGIKTTEIEADKVIIQGKDSNIVINNPQVTKMEMQGITTFQISGSVSMEASEKEAVEISKEDIEFIKSQTGIEDEERIAKALSDANGDIAEALLKLKENKQA